MVANGEPGRPAGEVVVGRAFAKSSEGRSGMPRTRAPIREPALCVLTAEPGLSLSAKGLACYLLTRPPRPVTYGELFSVTSDPMSLIHYAARELEAVGMVTRVAGRGRGRPRDTAGIQLVTPTANVS
jgi:hypothetical protein